MKFEVDSYNFIPDKELETKSPKFCLFLSFYQLRNFFMHYVIMLIRFF